MHRDAAYDGAFAARHRDGAAQQADHVAGIDMEGEFEVGLRQAFVDFAGLRADVDDVADQMAVAVLRYRIADMARETPVNAHAKIRIPALDRQSTQIAEAQLLKDAPAQ